MCIRDRSDAIFAGFMFEQTEPVAEKTLTPNFWTNGTVEIDLSAGDNLSGVRDITLPDGSIVDAAQAKYTVDKNGVYNFSVRDYCGNVLSLSLIHIYVCKGDFGLYYGVDNMLWRLTGYRYKSIICI